jgi:hypothetical protein
MLIGALFLSFAVSAEEGPPADKRWIPSISLTSAGLPEDRKAEAESDISGYQDGESVGFPWSIGSEVGLASPVLSRSMFKPRLIIHAGTAYVLDGNDPVSTVGDTGNPPAENPFQPDPDSIENQGSAVKVQAKEWVLTGGVGALFELEAFDRTFFLRPSLEWMYRKDEIQTFLGAGEGETLDADGNCAPCRTLFIDSQTEKGYHSLGAGLEASIDGGRMGDFLARFFASARVYHILGDRKTSLNTTGTWLLPDGSPSSRVPPTTTFNARYEREPVHYRVGVGLQLLWQPE